MGIKRGKLEFQNVLSINTRCNMNNWKDRVETFKKFILDNDLFTTGPIILRWEEAVEGDTDSNVCIMLPIYQRLNLSAKVLEVYGFKETLCIEDGLKIRNVDLDEEEGQGMKATQTIIEIIAEKVGVELVKPYYYIYLPVYGEYVVDVFAPIK